MEHITRQIAQWLDSSGKLPLSKDGFASCALQSDYSEVCRINQEMRALPTPWPDDQWIIGEDGAGGYFVISKEGSYEGVQFFDHEWWRFEVFKPTLREFFDCCMDHEPLK